MAKEIMRPPEVAKLLGVSQQSVREHMKRGIWDLGECVAGKERGRQVYEYNIYRAKLEKMIGRKLEEGEV